MGVGGGIKQKKPQRKNIFPWRRLGFGCPALLTIDISSGTVNGETGVRNLREDLAQHIGDIITTIDRNVIKLRGTAVIGVKLHTKKKHYQIVEQHGGEMRKRDFLKEEVR